MDFLELLIPVAGLTVNAAVQLVAARTWRHPGLLFSILTGFAAGLAATCAFEAWAQASRDASWSQAAPLFIVNVATYVALSYCFFAFLNLGETSLRIRIFSELRQRPVGLSEAEMLERYNPRGMMEVRLERLVRGNQLVKRGERYYLEGRALPLIATLIRSVKIIIVGKASEFEHGKGGARAAAEATRHEGPLPPVNSGFNQGGVGTSPVSRPEQERDP